MLELLGAVLAVAYLLLVTRRMWLAWPVYVASSLLYVPVFWSAQLYADAALQGYFIVMGIYAWTSWSSEPQGVSVCQWTNHRHRVVCFVWLIASCIVGGLLSKTPSGLYAVPDSIISVGSVIATALTARRVFQNWWYWMVINIVATGVFAVKGLWVTAALYGLYTALTVQGLMAWRSAFEKRSSEVANQL